MIVYAALSHNLPTNTGPVFSDVISYHTYISFHTYSVSEGGVPLSLIGASTRVQFSAFLRHNRGSHW